MSEVLHVPTHFEDLGELSEGFVDRVDQDTLILYGPVPYEDGIPIDFTVLLSDGTTALEGSGKVRAAVDGGEERVPETRYDVVIEGLAFDGRFEAIFESLVLTRQRVSEPPTGSQGQVTFEQAPGEGLSRPSLEDQGDLTEDQPPRVPVPSTGLFQYGGPLPIPERPPAPGDEASASTETAPDSDSDESEEHE